MVQITPEEVMEMRRKSVPSDVMPEWKRDLVGDSARLDIPLDSAYFLRKAQETASKKDYGRLELLMLRLKPNATWRDKAASAARICEAREKTRDE